MFTDIHIQVSDLANPTRPYLNALRAARDHGGPLAIKGYRKRPGKAGRWHCFTIKTRRLSNFVEDVSRMVKARRLKVYIDGERLRPVDLD